MLLLFLLTGYYYNTLCSNGNCALFVALRPKIAKSKEMAELKDNFIMVNTEDGEEPKGKQFDQDGQYVPRIFFLGE